MKKRILGIILVTMVLVGSAVTASAYSSGEYRGDDIWNSDICNWGRNYSDYYHLRLTHGAISESGNDIKNIADWIRPTCWALTKVSWSSKGGNMVSSWTHG